MCFLVRKIWDFSQIFIVLVEKFAFWLCCQCNEFETVWIYQTPSKRQWQHRKERWLFKVEPVVHALGRNCLSIEQEQYQSIDKQMVPAETIRSGIHQYLPKKIHMWGFKNFFQAGIIYDFFSSQDKKVLGERNVVRLE